MSSAVTSFWKSTNAFCFEPATCQSGVTANESSSAFGTSSGFAGNPVSSAVREPASMLAVKQPLSVIVPFAAPTTDKPFGNGPGTKAARSSFQAGRLP